MPIRASQRARYPANWRAISLRIRTERAEGGCECTGQCGTDHDAERADIYQRAGKFPGRSRRPRCLARNGRAHPITASMVVLTVAHLNHTPEDCRDENLLAMCQRCHLRYDADHHAETRAAAQAEALAASMALLFDLPEGTTCQTYQKDPAGRSTRTSP